MSDLRSVLDGRAAGVLLHVTSLPSPGPAGRLDGHAERFVDWLAEAGFRVWQVLPLGPTHADHSPYLSLSAFAGNPAFISLERLRDDPLLRDTWLARALAEFDRYDVEDLAAMLTLGGKEYSFQALPEASAFLDQHRYWLRDYAQFMTLRHAQGGRAWWDWPTGLRQRDPQAVRAELDRHLNYYRAVVIEQYLFQRQWGEVKRYANRRGVRLFGDMPLYVSQDSADVWAWRRYFTIDDDGHVTAQAGVPPDYFSSTGQVWGNPVFDWDALAADDFRWWVERVRRQLELLDLLRIDHFRGLQAFWRIPAGHDTAEHGEWVPAPGEQLLDQLRATLGALPLVAEDLGYITPEVEALRQKFHLPSMRVLQFAFDGGDDNPHLPNNYDENVVAYTGTHDNDTILGWYASLPPETRDYVRHRLGVPDGDERAVLEAMVRAILFSPALLAMLPMQDVLGLGPGNRMNTPGTTEGNWRWRFRWEQLHPDLTRHYHQLLTESGRC